MQTNLENLSSLERRLNVTVPKDEIETEVENRLKRLARTIKLHGFRPGKVPLKVVAQQFGTQVRQEVLGDTLQKSFSEAIRQQNLKVAGYPRFEAKPLEQNSAQFEYSATFEIYPKVTLGELSNTGIERPSLQVGDENVVKTIEILRKQRIKYEPVERSAASGDRVSVDYQGTVDGKEFAGGAAKDAMLVLGDSQLLKDFENQITGMIKGQSKTFELRFPEDYHGKEIAGKTAVFELTLKEVGAPKLPDVDADFAKSLGVEDGDLEKMRAEIRANLEREVKKRVESRIKDQVMQALIDTTKIELPKSLIEMERERLMHAARHDLESRGLKVKDMPMPPDLFEEQAKRRVSLGLILAELVKLNNLHAKPEQVRTIVEEHAQSYEHPGEVVKWYYASPDRLKDAEALALEENVVAWALSRAKTVDEPISFDELMGK